mgnify:CR=1 FL=1
MIAAIAIGGFLVAGACAGVRLLRGPTLADRVVALDVALMSLMGGIATHAASEQDGTNLSLLVVIAIVGFTATVAASRFIEHEAARP